MDVGDVDDGAVLFGQMRCCCLRQKQRAFQVACHQVLPHRFVNFANRAAKKFGSIVDDAIKLAKVLDGDIDEHPAGFISTEIGIQGNGLAAVVSGEAEQDFDKGYAVNLDGTRALFEAIRVTENYTPRVVYTSSIATFGAPYRGAIADEFFHTPLSSYGTQKAICELLLADYSRRGFLDGVGIRLPNICVRPGKPNAASSGFFSSIIREPLAGREAILPVADSVRQTHASPRATVEFLLHAATLDSDALGHRRTLMMPGVPASIAEQIDALRRVAGAAVAARVRHVPDPAIMAMVAGWPTSFDTPRALSLGFRAESSFEVIIRTHIHDDLGGKFVS